MNINDPVHFKDTYEQLRGRLKPGSILVFDHGANGKLNIDRIENYRLKYVTGRRINKSKWNTYRYPSLFRNFLRSL